MLETWSKPALSEPRRPAEACSCLRRFSQDKRLTSARAPGRGDRCGAVTALFPRALLAPAGDSSPRVSVRVETSSPAATASGSMSAPSEPLPGKRRHFSYLAAPWEASSQPEVGRRPRRPSHAHTSAHAPPAPGPGLQRWGRQALRIPAINHKAFGNSIIVYPNPFGQRTVTERIGVLGWCLACPRLPRTWPAGLLSAVHPGSWLLGDRWPLPSSDLGCCLGSRGPGVLVRHGRKSPEHCPSSQQHGSGERVPPFPRRPPSRHHCCGSSRCERGSDLLTVHAG